MAIFLLPNPAEAQQKAASDRARVDDVLKGLGRGRIVGQVAVSPDGKRLAWLDYGDARGPEIRVAPLKDGDHLELNKAERVTAAARPETHCREEDLAWAPDSTRLAFFSDCAKPGEQSDLYLSLLDGQPARRISALNGYMQAPVFSPDGRSVAFLYVEGATRPAGALAAMKPPAGVIGEDGVEIQRVAVAHADAEKPRPTDWATPKDLHVYEFDWAPDSQGLAYVAAEPPGENNWWVAKLYAQRRGGAPQAIFAPTEASGAAHGMQIAVPRWSPDARRIAFIGGLMSDQGSTGGDVWMVAVDGGPPVDLTPGRTATPEWIEWDGSGHIDVMELAGGDSRLSRLRLQEATVEHSGETRSADAEIEQPVFSIPGTVGDGRLEMSLSATGNHELFVFRASSLDHPVEIYAARPGREAKAGLEGVTRLTHWNKDVDPAWGKAVSLTWKSDGFQVQGWLLTPRGFDPNRMDAAKKYPLIVEVHGGPAAATLSHWGANGGFVGPVYSALGYFVLEPNPRGSFGQGEAFVRGNRKDFGYGDLRDILAGVDTVLANYPVDAGRVGLTGWSYGGFMSMFAVTQTNRFKAAVAGAGISDWLSYYGENSIDQWMTPYFGASVYDDPAVYARSSAISYIRQARTPTLVVVGDRDGECPAPQSFEFWHALRDQGVPTQLVVYPNEGHGFVDAEHRRDVLERGVEWFEKYMPAK
jgi:dipeptidyl aminopeptidase/acylaminoacyl peptidase